MKWVTRARPVIDRIACPWLIARFIDKQPEFLFVPPDQVSQVAAETGAIPYDVPGVELTHVGEGCSFDSFVSKYGLNTDPAIVTIASIVRGADTDRHDLTPQSAGLLAISMGLRDLSPDDHEVLNHGFIIYDALYHCLGPGSIRRWILDMRHTNQATRLGLFQWIVTLLLTTCAALPRRFCIASVTLFQPLRTHLARQHCGQK